MRETLGMREATRDTAQHGNRYDDSLKELAYQLWAFKCGRDSRQVASELLQAEDVQVNDRTIRYWSTAYQWSERASSDLAAIAPDMLRTSVSELIAGSHEASRYLRRVVNGAEERPDKVRVAAAMAILDRVGIGPRRPEGETPTLTLPDRTSTRQDYSQLTDEELARLERGE
jgi:hypothetical protein